MTKITTMDELVESINNWSPTRFDSVSSEYGFFITQDHDGILISYADHGLEYEDEEYKDIDDLFSANEFSLEEYNITKG